jgi:hypothetical protein
MAPVPAALAVPDATRIGPLARVAVAHVPAARAAKATVAHAVTALVPVARAVSVTTAAVIAVATNVTKNRYHYLTSG